MPDGWPLLGSQTTNEQPSTQHSTAQQRTEAHNRMDGRRAQRLRGSELAHWKPFSGLIWMASSSSGDGLEACLSTLKEYVHYRPHTHSFLSHWFPLVCTYSSLWRPVMSRLTNHYALPALLQAGLELPTSKAQSQVPGSFPSLPPRETSM